MTRPRVLVLGNCAANPHTGSGAVIALALDELALAGARVEFFHLGVKGIGGTLRAARYLAPLRAWRHARALLRQEAWDVVVCFGGEWGLFARTAPRTRRWRLVQYSNGVESHAAATVRMAWGEPGFRKPRWFQRGDLSSIHDLAFRHVDHVAVVSEFDARYLREVLALPADAVTVLSSPLPDYFLGLPLATTRPPVVGFCGGWSPIKNISLIARDVQAFLRAFPEWRFEAVGPGTEGIVASGAFGADVLPRVRGLGPRPREQLPGWYRQCSIVLLPSVYDSFGLAAAEATACGCALVGSPNSGYAASLEHGEEVYRLRSGRTPELERALAELASDPALLTRIARGGHRRAQALTRAAWRSGFLDCVMRLKELAP
jgi:glycosyltransferase involved in cell wall biosynthesis